MDGGAIARHNVLERMLLDDSAEPTNLTLSLLEAITKNFSDDLQIGSGGFAVVYKGMLVNGTVAVKKLNAMLDIDENKFNNEVNCLMGVKHKNIVRVLGYCSDTQGQFEKYDEKFVMADVRHRLLCFEYLPKGSLDEYITDASHGLGWKVRYQIIKGICEGLHYLHQKNIVHLDLKPANILLDDSMVPKIADFGLSRCFDEKQSWTITSKLIGSLGYLAPEFYSGRITLKLDIYSLGVIIIEILTGKKGYSAVEEVVESWMNRLEISEGDTLLEQVRVCAEIGNECMNFDPVKRPVTRHIIKRLDKTGNTDWSVEIGTISTSTGNTDWSVEIGTISTSAVQVHANWRNRLQAKWSDSSLEAYCQQVMRCTEIALRYMEIYRHNRPDEVHANWRNRLQAKWRGFSLEACCQQVMRRTEIALRYMEIYMHNRPDEVSVPLAPSDGVREILSVKPLQLRFPLGLEPNKSMISCPLHLTNRTDHHVIFRLLITKEYFMGPLYGVVPPRCSYTLALTMCTRAKPPANSYDFFTLESCIATRDIGWYGEYHFEEAKEEGREVHQVKLMAIYEQPGPGMVTSQPKKRRIMIQSEIGKVTSLDVHPTKPWILTNGFFGVGIWNYRTQEIRDVSFFALTVTSVKFVARKQWFVAGVSDGSIYVYSCDTMKEICHLRRAHSKDVNSLAIHATEPYLLSASSDGHIKLWDYEKDWMLIKGWQSGDVRHVAFSPKDTNIFATAEDFTIKIWNLDLSACTMTLFGTSTYYLDYFSRGDELYLIACCGSNTIKIWDYQTGSHVKTLSGHTSKVNAVCAHPNLPILITGSNDGTVCLWSKTTFELECTLNFGLGEVYALGCSQGYSRIAIGNRFGLVLTEVDLG